MLNARRYYTIPKDDASLAAPDTWFLNYDSCFWSCFFLFYRRERERLSNRGGALPIAVGRLFSAVKDAKPRYPCAFWICAGY
jgi:hypothetical protein